MMMREEDRASKIVVLGYFGEGQMKRLPWIVATFGYVIGTQFAFGQAMPEQQMRFCQAYLDNNNAVRAYTAKALNMNPIEKERSGPPPDFTAQLSNGQVAALGKTGEFSDWVGTINFSADGEVNRKKTVFASLTFTCANNSRTVTLSSKHPYYPPPSLPEDFGIIYLDSPLASQLASLPDPHKAAVTVLASGRMAYIPPNAKGINFDRFANPLGFEPTQFAVTFSSIKMP